MTTSKSKLVVFQNIIVLYKICVMPASTAIGCYLFFYGINHRTVKDLPKSYTATQNPFTMDLEKLKIFLICHYSLAKFIIKKIFPNAYLRENITILAQIPIIVLTAIILICCVPILIVFYCKKQIIIFILKCRYRSKFVSLITGCDSLSSLTDEDGVVISTVFFIDSKKNGEDLFQDISKKVWNELTHPQMAKKLVSVRKLFMGYLYLEEVDDLNPEDVLKCVRSDKSEIPEKELAEFLNYHCNFKPLPLNGRFNWDLIIVTTPLRKYNGETRYLMIFRMHHFIVDGLTMYNLIKRITKTEEDETVYGDTISTKLRTQQYKRIISSNLKMLSTYNIAQTITDESQTKFKPKTKGHLAIFNEPTQNCVLKLKEIRKKIPGVPFNALILTAYSASLAEYFKDFTPKNIKIPTKLDLITPVQINMERFSKYYGNKEKTLLGNDFSFFSTTIPIIQSDKRNTPIEDYLMERLEMITRSFYEYNTNIDYMFNYTLTKTYFDVLPIYAAQPIMKVAFYNIMMSVFPGGPKLKTLQGDEIEIFMFMLPLESRKVDINFLSLSYDERFQFVQIINENKFESVEKMDDVLKGILKYVDILYEQIVKNSLE